MMRFNFLPWREEKRRQKKSLFHSLALTQLFIGLSLVLAVWFINEDKLKAQLERNQLLHSEIKKLDLKITEVSNLKQEIDDLLMRQSAIENLQNNRNKPVYLLSFLAERVPAGAMLKSLKQGDQIALSGLALSNARVSELLRNLSQAPKQLSMGQPELIEVKAVNYGQGKDLRKLFDFTLSIPVAAE